MKTNVLIIPLVAVALSATSLFASDVTHARVISFRSVEAKFQYIDTSVCSEGVVMNVTVLGLLGSLGTGKGTDVSAVSLSLVAEDECSGSTVVFSTGQTNANYDLRIDPNLNTATLHVRLLVHDYLAEDSSYFDIDMVWTGAGRTQKEVINDKEHTAEVLENSHVIVDTRDAAASGSVVSLSSGQNFTPGAPVSATFQTMQGGLNQVVH